MTLTANTLPSQVPTLTLPLDASTQFASAQTLTATGYINNTNAVIDLANGAATTWGAGRMIGWLALDITAIDMSSGDETYKIHLFGSNDSAFGNGNVELLAMHDFAAAVAGRQVATILGISPTIPPTNLSGTVMALPFCNLMQRIVYRYLKLYAVIGGTTPSITLSAWLSPLEAVC